MGEPTLVDEGSETPVAAPPQYVVHTRLNAGDDLQLSYLATTSSIEAGARLDLDRAVELDAPDIGFAGLVGTPYVYTGSCTEPTITRWEVASDGSLREGPQLSFAPLGLADACIDSALGLYSPQRAFYRPFQSAIPEIVVWNPTTMEIVGTIELPGVEPEGELLPVVTLSTRSDRLFVTVFWEGGFDADWTKFGDHVRVLEIDPESLEVLSSSDEPRCNSLSWTSATSDETAYFSPYSYNTTIRSVLGDERGAQSCGLRIVPPGSSFDQGYELDLSAIAGGRPAGDLVVLDDETAFLHVWHEELVSPLAADGSNWEDVIGENGFLWYKWPLGASTAERIPEQTPGNFTVLVGVEDRKFVAHFSDDFSSTTLEELDASGAITPALSGAGQIFEVVRVR